jgi:hypothetical protein
MCCMFLQELEGCIKCLLFGLLCCLCIGPILFIIGIILLVGRNDRASHVSQYNDAVGAYNRVDGPTLAGTDMTAQGTLAMDRNFVPVQVFGDRSGVDSTNHYVFSRLNVPRGAGDAYTIAITTANATGGVLTWNIPWTATVNRPLVCTQTQCDQDCGSSDYSCSTFAMRTYCQNTYGGSYSDNDGSCDAGEVCGYCLYSGNLNRACVVIAFVAGTPTRSTTYESCYYPFTQHDYFPGSTALTLEVMSETDPFIKIESLTQGSHDFGVTAAQQRTTGIILIILGILLTCLVGGLIYCFVQYNSDKKERAPPPPPPEHQTTYVIREVHTYPYHNDQHRSSRRNSQDHHNYPPQQPYNQQNQPYQQNPHYQQQPPPPQQYQQQPPPPQQYHEPAPAGHADHPPKPL